MSNPTASIFLFGGSVSFFTLGITHRLTMLPNENMEATWNGSRVFALDEFVMSWG
ncbi:MAG: hypothetical protein ACI8R4_004285 [Paracoccaceae bacterium]|jgi:hypothetical protein